MSTIEIKGVSKTYGKVKALTDIDLTIKENCIYGLLGRNGAGKSTLLNVITNRTFADCGEILIDGEKNLENDRALGKIHMMSEQLLYNPSLKVSQMFSTAAFYYPDFDMRYAETLCGEYGLDMKKLLRRLSTGYRTIAKIICALSCNALIVFFDEPVLGLDAGHREMFYRHVINRFNEHPATYVISTHLIEEAANLIERAVVIKDGCVLLDEDVETIREMGYTVSGKITDVDKFISDKEVMGQEVIGMLKTAYVKGNRRDQFIPEELEAGNMTLQNIFINLTNP